MAYDGAMDKAFGAILCAVTLLLLPTSSAGARGKTKQDRLLDRLKEPGDSVERANAALDLAKLGDRSVTSDLLDAVRPGKDGSGADWLLQRAVVAALAGLKEVREKEIRKALSDDSEEVRAVALEVLAQRSPGGRALAARYLLTDESNMVRARALDLVVSMRSKDTRKALERMAAADPDPGLRRRAALAIELAGKNQGGEEGRRQIGCGGVAGTAR